MEFDFWMLFAGIGIFLFGIYLMEESLKAISGRAFKDFIRRYTSNRFKALGTGTLATAVLQSSSAVILMVLAFVGAGIMQLSSAFGVILGSNLGTTFTSWIVASLGFKVDIESLSLPFIGIGGMSLIFLGRTSKIANYSKLMVGFGFLFLGLSYMKTSVEQVTQNFDLSAIADYPLIFFVLIGFVITAIMQSSSASMAIILTALFGEVIDFYTASALVIGANLGTTVTAIIGSLGGIIVKKQVASVHVIFNFVTAIVAFILLKPLNYLVLEVVGLKNDPVIALALFHTIFKVLGIILFLPFTNQFSRLIEQLIKDKKVHLTKYIHNTSPEVAEAGLEALHKETAFLIELVMLHNLQKVQVKWTKVFSQDELNAIRTNKSKVHLYQQIKSLQSEIFLYASQIKSNDLSEQEMLQFNQYLHSIRYAAAAAKSLKDIEHEFELLQDSKSNYITEELEKANKFIIKNYQVINELMNNRSPEKNLAKIIKYNTTIHQRDQNSVVKLSQMIKEKQLNATEVASLISFSRNFTLAHRQINLSVKDYLLSSDETELLEQIENIELEA
ncbi:MAG: Na/Pi symporter [Flavobacteriaceae bacterium]|nr:Na/Pi symporter [Flavobacteriaceae bacterium]